MTSANRRRARADWREPAAVAAVAVVAVLSWLLVAGAATGVYRQFARYGDPPLLQVAVPGPDPAAHAAPTPDAAVSELGHYGYFWSERAFHYRTTLMFAGVGGPAAAVLKHDTGQQHPDGVDAWREYTLMMEPLYGALYRLAGDQSRPPVEFLLKLVPLVHVLLLLPLYVLARALGAGRPAAVAAAAAASAAPVGYARLVGALLLKEDFALLLLLLFVALHSVAWRRGSRPLTLVAALVLAALLASWHLAQFLAAAVLAAAALAHAIAPDDEDRRGRWFMPAAYLGAFVLAGLTPSLRARAFLVSLPTAVPVAWLLAALLAPRLRGRASSAAGRVLVLAAPGLLLAAAALANPWRTADYGHVTSLFLAKLQHGFVRPDDPSQLTWAVRQFWAPPFHTPSLDEVLGGVGAVGLLLAVGLAWSVAASVRRGTPGPVRALALLVPVLAALWLLAARLGLVFLPFAAVAGVLALQGLVARRAPARAALAAASFVVVMVALNLATVLSGPVALARDVRAGRPAAVATSDDTRGDVRAELLRWLTRRTPGPGSSLGGPPGAVLADIGLSPEILLYTGRPVVLNSQFENVAIRQRTERFQAALYAEDPSALQAFCREFDVRWLVIDRTMALADEPGSPAWVAGARRPLTTAMTVVRLHTAPESVAGFRPAWDNEYYRVFAVVDPRRPAASGPWETRGSIWWQQDNLTIEGGELVDLAGDRARLAAREARAVELQDAQAAVLRGLDRRRPGGAALLTLQRQQALAALDRCAGGAGPEPGAEARLANAVQALLADVDPATGLSTAQALGRLLDGQDGWRSLLQAGRPEPTQLAVAAQLAATAGRWREAADLFRSAAGPAPAAGEASPLQRQLWDETILWLCAAGRCDEALAGAADWQPAAGRDGPGALVRRLAPAP